MGVNIPHTRSPKKTRARSVDQKSSSGDLLEIFKEQDDEIDQSFLDDNDVEIIQQKLRGSHIISSHTTPTKRRSPIKRLSPVKKKTPPRHQNVPTGRNWTVKIANRISDLTIEEFEQFRKVDILGKGAFGEVYKVHHEPSGRFFAMKRVSFTTEEEDTEAILKEIMIMKNLRHRNIVRLFHYRLDPENLNLIMEYCSGGSLAQVLKTNGQFSEKQCVQYTNQILAGLSYLHSHNIVHRDIKAANILLANETVKLADFGVSLNMNEANETLRKEPNGSIYWMAPEVIKMQGASAASDIWSLGATVIEMLTCVPPFAQYDPMPACHAIGMGEPIEYPKSASPVCLSFLRSCLVMDPSKRLSAERLQRHPWFQGSQKSASATSTAHVDLTKYQEGISDFQDYEDEFDDSAFVSLDTSHKSAQGRRMLSPEEEFEEELKICKNIETSTLGQLKKVIHFDRPELVKCITDNNFSSALVFSLCSPQKSLDDQLEMLRIAVPIFEKHPTSVDEFCTSGCISAALRLFDSDKNTIFRLLKVISGHSAGMQALAAAGVHSTIALLLQERSPKFKSFAVHLVHKLYSLPSVSKPVLTTGFIAQSVPEKLAPALDAFTGTAGADTTKMVLDDIEFIYKNTSPHYRKEFMTKPFYESVLSSFENISQHCRYKALRLLMGDEHHRDVLQSVRGTSPAIQLVMRDLGQAHQHHTHAFPTAVKVSIEFLDSLFSDDDNKQVFFDRGGLYLLQKLLEELRKRETDPKIRDRALELLFKVADCNAQLHRNPALLTQLLNTLWNAVDSPKLGLEALDRIIALAEEGQKPQVVEGLGSVDNYMRIISCWKGTSNANKMLDTLGTLIKLSIAPNHLSALAERLSLSQEVVDMLYEYLISGLAERDKSLGLISLLYKHGNRNGPLQGVQEEIYQFY